MLLTLSNIPICFDAYKENNYLVSLTSKFVHPQPPSLDTGAAGLRGHIVQSRVGKDIFSGHVTVTIPNLCMVVMYVKESSWRCLNASPELIAIE